MRILRGRLLFVAVGSVAALAVPGVAWAAPPTPNDDPGKISQEVQPHINHTDPIVKSTVGGSRTITPMVTGSGGQINGYTARTITPPGGQAGTYNLGFNSNYTQGCSIVTCWRDVTSGTSYTRWLGTTPYSANSIALTDQIWVGGVSISISVGTSPSAGVSVANNTVTMSNAIANNWRNEHNFANINFDTHVSIWGPYENANSAATFSYQTFYNTIN